MFIEGEKKMKWDEICVVYQIDYHSHISLKLTEKTTRMVHLNSKCERVHKHNETEYYSCTTQMLNK